ncbi:hypothetical protein Tco_1196363, partial [Tanacetum coccineum]
QSCLLHHLRLPYIYTDLEPGRVLWGVNEELSDDGPPRVIVYGYDGLPMQPPHDPDYVPEPIYPEYIPLEDEHSDPEEDLEEYEDDESDPEDGDDDDGDSSRDDADDEDEDEEEEDEHLAPSDSAVIVPTIEPVSPPEGTEPVIPPPSIDISTTGARITVWLQASIS